VDDPGSDDRSDKCQAFRRAFGRWASGYPAAHRGVDRGLEQRRL